MRRAWALAAAVALLPGAARAQTTLEVRAGMAVGSHTATAAGLEMKPALSYAAVLTRELSPRLALFGGWFRTAFGCEAGFCTGRDLEVVGSHGGAGAQLTFGGAWVRGGLLVGTTEVGEGGEAPELGAGILAAAGLSIGSGRVRFVPGVSYRWMAASTPSSPDHAVALAADLGLAVRVGGGG